MRLKPIWYLSFSIFGFTFLYIYQLYFLHEDLNWQFPTWRTFFIERVWFKYLEFDTWSKKCLKLQATTVFFQNGTSLLPNKCMLFINQRLDWLTFAGRGMIIEENLLFHFWIRNLLELNWQLHLKMNILDSQICFPLNNQLEFFHQGLKWQLYTSWI